MGTDHGFSVLTFHSTRTGAIKPRQPVNSDVGLYGAKTPQADGFRYLYKD